MKVIECVSGKGGATMTHKILKMLMLTALLAGIGTSSLTNAQADSTQKTTASATLVSGVNGGIKLDSAPDVSFSAQLTGNEIKDLAGTQTDDLQVTNAGSATGWNVKVAASAMTDADGQPLAGATYGFTTTAAKPLDENNNSKATANNLSFDGAGSGEQIAMQAAPKEGLGIWQGNYAKSQMTVPANAMGGVYTATLTWTLGNTPE